MKALILILWLQVLAGLACLCFSFGAMHSGALGMEWANEVRTEYLKRATSPDFKAPADINGVKHAQLPDNLLFYARKSMRQAWNWFVFSSAVTLAGAVMLFLSYRVRSKAIIERGDPSTP
jgi:hypothetical protein